MKGNGPGRNLERERAWREVMNRQRQSGLSVREFCRRAVVSEASFSAWRRELQRRDRDSASGPRPDRESEVRPAASRSAVAKRTPTTVSGPAAFVPVLMESNPDHTARVLEVNCPNGSRVSAWLGCEVELLQAALSVVTRTAGVRRKGSLRLWGIDPSSVKRQKRYLRPASTASRDPG